MYIAVKLRLENRILKKYLLLLLLLLLSLLFTAFAVVYILRMDSRPDSTAIIDWAKKSNEPSSFRPYTYRLSLSVSLYQYEIR